jgi:hypothetical protein
MRFSLQGMVQQHPLTVNNGAAKKGPRQGVILSCGIWGFVLQFPP